MRLVKIKSIVDPGISNDERVVFKATGSDNLGLYLAFSTRETKPGFISSSPKNVFWFPDQEVKMGDLVVLYTKQGSSSQRKNTDGSMIYFYYWDINTTMWNNSTDSIALLKIEGWEYKSRG